VKKLIRHCTAIFVSCLMVPAAVGQSRNIVEVRTIAVSPYGIIDDDQQSGIYFDTANILIAEAGYEASNQIYPYARIIKELKTGQTDMTIMFRYPELEDHVTFIAPLPALKTVVIGIQGSTFDSVESLEGKTIAYLRGGKFSHEIDSHPEIIRYDTNDFFEGIRLLIAGRVDAIIGPLTPIISAAEQAGHDEQLFGTPLIVDQRIPWVQISNQSKNRISTQKLKAAFESMVRRGELDRLRQKYVGKRRINRLESR